MRFDISWRLTSQLSLYNKRPVHYLNISKHEFFLRLHLERKLNYTDINKFMNLAVRYNFSPFNFSLRRTFFLIHYTSFGIVDGLQVKVIFRSLKPHIWDIRQEKDLLNALQFLTGMYGTVRAMKTEQGRLRGLDIAVRWENESKDFWGMEACICVEVCVCRMWIGSLGFGGFLAPSL